MPTPSSDPPGTPPSHVHEIACGDIRLLVTSCPPLPVEWGGGWWVCLGDVWVELRRREPGEVMTPELARELCALLGTPGDPPTETAPDASG